MIDGCSFEVGAKIRCGSTSDPSPGFTRAKKNPAMIAAFGNSISKRLVPISDRCEFLCLVPRSAAFSEHYSSTQASRSTWRRVYALMKVRDDG